MSGGGGGMVDVRLDEGAGRAERKGAGGRGSDDDDDDGPPPLVPPPPRIDDAFEAGAAAGGEEAAGAGEGEEDAAEALCHACGELNAFDAVEAAFACFACGAANYLAAPAPGGAPPPPHYQQQASFSSQQHPPHAMFSQQQQQQQQLQQQRQQQHAQSVGGTPMAAAAAAKAAGQPRRGRAAKSNVPRVVGVVSMGLVVLMFGVVGVAMWYAVTLLGDWGVWTATGDEEDKADLWFRRESGTDLECDALLEGLSEKDPAGGRFIVDKSSEAGLVFFSGIFFYAAAAFSKVSVTRGVWRNPERFTRKQWRLVERKVASRSKAAAAATRVLQAERWQQWKDWREVHLGRLLQLGKFFALDPLFAVKRECEAETMPDSMVGVAIFAMVVVAVTLAFTLVKRCGNRSCACGSRSPFGAFVSVAMYLSAVAIAVLMVLALDVRTLLSIPSFGSDDPVPNVLKVANLAVVAVELVLHALVITRVPTAKQQAKAAAAAAAGGGKGAALQQQHAHLHGQSGTQLATLPRQQSSPPAIVYAAQPQYYPQQQQQQQQQQQYYAQQQPQYAPQPATYAGGPSYLHSPPPAGGGYLAQQQQQQHSYSGPSHLQQQQQQQQPYQQQPPQQPYLSPEQQHQQGSAQY